MSQCCSRKKCRFTPLKNIKIAYQRFWWQQICQIFRREDWRQISKKTDLAYSFIHTRIGNSHRMEKTKPEHIFSIPHIFLFSTLVVNCVKHTSGKIIGKKNDEDFDKRDLKQNLQLKHNNFVVDSIWTRSRSCIARILDSISLSEQLMKIQENRG